MTREHHAPPKGNTLGLSAQPSTPQAERKPTVFDCLEEVANDLSANGKHPARNAIDKYSPGPMPPIQDTSPMAIFEYIHLDTIKEWDLCTGGKLITIPFDSEARSLEMHKFICTRILTAVMEIVSAQEISVVAPKPNEKAVKKNHTPMSFLIYNISTEQADILLMHKVWSLKSISFCIAPFVTMCPTFLFTIKGFTSTAMKLVFNMVKGVWDNQDTRDFIDTLLNDVVKILQDLEICRDIKMLLASMNIMCLDIKTTGNTLCPHFNVYVDSDTFTNDKTWTFLRAHLQTVAYTSANQGCAVTERAPFRCSCCHRVDHLRGLCPFPNLPGWNGPKKDGSDTPQ
ncbi:hypothetical protein V8E53_009071 [Lactarius tabidus]